MSVLPLNRFHEDLSLFAGGGEMRARCRALNWAATPLGPVTTWSHSLRTIVATLLASHHPMFLWWGVELVQIYNDGYRLSLGGGRHPRALGMRGREFWTEIWDIISPQIDAVMSRGESSWHVDQLVPIDRNGRMEEVYWTYGYSPVLDDDGSIGGTLVVCQETTNAVVATRRLQTLHTLAAFTSNHSLAMTAVETTRLLAADSYDVPFAICFLENTRYWEQSRTDHVRTDRVHFTGQSYAPPPRRWMLAHVERLLPQSGLTSPDRWPLDAVIASRDIQIVPMPMMTAPQKIDPWPEPPTSAVVIPLFHPGTSMPLGVLVLGVSARLPWDEAYEKFVHLAAVDIATHLAACSDQEESIQAHHEAERLLTESEAARHDAELARTAAEGANRAKADFLATMSHELRTPLNAIGGYAELIALGIHGPVTVEQVEALSRLQASQRHLLGLINDLLNYTRLEAGAVHYDLRATSANEIIHSCEALIAPQMRMKGLHFRCEPCDTALQVYTDGEKLRQILLNLLTNATKFTEPGGIITISSEVLEDTVAIHVTDTGSGIAEDQFDNIFDPFVQIDSRLTRSEQGVGLGLAISRDLARGMGGELTVRSTVGVGSTFTVVLPKV